MATSPLRLSVLDQSPVPEGSTGAQALRNTVDLAVLASDDFAAAVREDEQLAARIGIRGVPYFVLDRRFGVSGAQPAELLVQALERACS